MPGREMPMRGARGWPVLKMRPRHCRNKALVDINPVNDDSVFLSRFTSDVRFTRTAGSKQKLGPLLGAMLSCLLPEVCLRDSTSVKFNQVCGTHLAAFFRACHAAHLGQNIVATILFTPSGAVVQDSLDMPSRELLLFMKHALLCSRETLAEGQTDTLNVDPMLNPVYK